MTQVRKRHGPPADADVCGLPWSGAGALPMALHDAFPELAVDAVEPDRKVADIAAHFFGVPRGDARLQLHLTDGAAFLADSRHIGQVLSGSAHAAAGFAAGLLASSDKP